MQSNLTLAKKASVKKFCLNNSERASEEICKYFNTREVQQRRESSHEIERYLIKFDNENVKTKTEHNFFNKEQKCFN